MLRFKNSFSARSMRNILLASTVVAFAAIGFQACRHEPVEIVDGNYPPEVASIFIKKCAESCHNSSNAKFSGDLNMETWQSLFKGGLGGAVVIPGDARFSTLVQYINTTDSSIVRGAPTMPLNAPALTSAEYETIKKWVLDGAKNSKGEGAYTSNPGTRQKIYVTQQGNNYLTVIDAASKMVMKYLKVGAPNKQTQNPHCFRADKQGRYGYVCFLNDALIQKIDLQTDQVIGEVTLALPLKSQFNVLTISEDGARLFATDYVEGHVAFVQTSDMSVISERPLPIGTPVKLHGIAALPSFDTFFITSELGNTLYFYTPSISPKYGKTISMDNLPPNNNASLDAHELILSPDNTKLFASCQGSDEVRVLDVKTYQLLKVIKVGKIPKELAISLYKPAVGSPALPYVFVSCINDDNPSARDKGSVYVINYETLEIVKILTANMYEPHGISVDDQRGLLYVFSVNSGATGPPPHHPSVTGGRNGFYSVYDLNTLEPAPNERFEVTEAPYSSDARFKGSIK